VPTLLNLRGALGIVIALTLLHKRTTTLLMLWNSAASRGEGVYLCTLLPNGVRWRDAHGATCRFAAIA
jgi:hypothetical protein